MKKNVRIMLGLLLIVAMLFGMTACGTGSDEPELITVADGDVVGDGDTEFPLSITDADGNTIKITVKTDETTVGAALVKLGVIAGEDSEYGLYIKTVNNITLDYNVDGLYWAFYIDGAYALTGVDMTDIAEGVQYELRAE